jgi:hypothetical protein
LDDNETGVRSPQICGGVATDNLMGSPTRTCAKQLLQHGVHIFFELASCQFLLEEMSKHPNMTPYMYFVDHFCFGSIPRFSGQLQSTSLSLASKSTSLFARVGRFVAI